MILIDIYILPIPIIKILEFLYSSLSTTLFLYGSLFAFGLLHNRRAQPPLVDCPPPPAFIIDDNLVRGRPQR